MNCKPSSKLLDREAWCSAFCVSVADSRLVIYFLGKFSPKLADYSPELDVLGKISLKITKTRPILFQTDKN